MIDNAKRLNCNVKISPHLNILMRLSLDLTTNGRDAVRLMSETLAEACQSRNDSIPEESYRMWLLDMLSRRFFNGFQQHATPQAPTHEETLNESSVGNNPLSPLTAAEIQQDSLLAHESVERVNYLRAINSLPRAFRSAMILSYLEGFSNAQIAELAGARQRKIASLLNRGFEIIRQELFAFLMNNDGPHLAAEQLARTA